MTELPAALERALRAGPPDESGYVARPIRDVAHDGTRADEIYLAVERVVPRTRARGGISTTNRRVSWWMALGAAASLAIGLVVGRATGPVGPGGAAGGSGKPLVQPAHVADELVNAWTRATVNLNSASTTWMVCLADRVLACEMVAAIDLGPAANSASQGGLSPSMPVRTYWSRLHPITIGAGHIAGGVAIAAGAGQVDAVDVRLMALDGPDNSPGVQIETVASATPCRFFDLGTIAPGSYALVIASNPTSPGSELYAAGLVVQSP